MSDETFLGIMRWLLIFVFSGIAGGLVALIIIGVASRIKQLRSELEK